MALTRHERLKIVRDLFRLGWPVLIAQLAVMANSVIDTVMAGRYGTLDLAAVGVGGAVYASVFVTLMGVLLGLTPQIAQLHGAGRHAAIGEEVRQSTWLCMVLGAVSVALLLAPGPILALSRLEPAVAAKTRTYLAALAWGVPAALLFRVFYSFTTAVSRPRAVMVINLVGLTLKVPLNLVFMYGYFGLPAMGGAGCGAATAVIGWIVCIGAWVYSGRARVHWPYRVFARWSSPDRRALARLLAVGLPIGVTFLVDVTAFTFMSLFIARLGPTIMGAHQVVANLAAVAFMLPLALGNAAAVLVGHAIGGNHYARARSTGIVALVLAVALGGVTGSVLALGARPITALYTSDASVHATATALLALVAIYHVFDAIQIVAVNVLRGYKRTVVPMVVYAVALWGLGLGGGYLVGLTDIDLSWLGIATPLGARGFWGAAIASLALAGALVTIYFLYVSRAIATGEGQSG